MTGNQKDNTQDSTKPKDHISDPKLSDDDGHDWTDEGGATPQGAATNTEAEPTD